MRRRWTWCCALWFAAAASAQERAFVEVRVAEQRVLVGQAVDVTVRIGLESELLHERLIQLFRQKLDVAVRLETPWARPIDGFAQRGAPPGFAAAESAVVDGALGALRRGEDVLRAGRRFETFEVARRLVPERAGALVIPGAVLQLAWASGFEVDFFGDRVPSDRHDERLLAEPVEVTVERRPAGAPALVGRFEARASLQGEPAVRVGGALSLQLVVEGEGDLAPFVAPDLSAWRAFHVRGVRESEEPGRRTVVYDLVVLRPDAREVPAISVPYLDPGPPPRSRDAVTQPIPLAVEPAGGALDPGAAPTPVETPPGAEETAMAAEPVPGVDVLFGLLPVAPREGGGAAPDFAAAPPLSRSVLVLALAVPWLYAAGLWLLRRRAGTRELRARRRRRRRARRAFRRALRDRERDRAAALARYLAAWLDCPAAAVVDPALPKRLRAAGLDDELAARLDQSLDALADARFGGAGGAPDDAALLALVENVDERLRARSAERAAASPAAALASCLVVLLAAPPDAQQGGDPRAAAVAFAAGDVARAFELYREALDAGGWDPAALCFDLGNCAHALGRPAEAVLWYARALRVAPGHLEARANLRLVERQLGLEDGGGRALGSRWLGGAAARVAAVPAGATLALAVVLQLLAWTGLVLRRRRGLSVAALAAGLALAALVTWPALEPAGETAVVVRAGSRLQAEPHARAGSAGTLQAGERVAVLEWSPRWARVRRRDGDGWVESRALELVSRASDKGAR